MKKRLNTSLKKLFLPALLVCFATLAQGQKETVITTYHFKKLKAVEGTMIDGKKTGTWKYRNRLGELIRVENYSNGLLNGAYAEYFDEERMNYSGSFDKKNYKIYLYKQKGDITGYPMLKGNYTDGKRDGEFDEWNYKGHIYLTQTFRNDTLNGPSKEFLANGKPLAFSAYKNGILDGEYIKFKSGDTVELGNYFKGKKEGEWKQKDTKYIIVAHYHEDSLHGTSTIYNRHNHKVLEVSEYVNGSKEGLSVSYEHARDQAIKTESMYRNGKRNGPLRRYAPEGWLMEEKNYTEDKPDGYFRTWQAPGILSEEGKYRNGEPDSTWNLYDTNGVLQKKMLYGNGKPEGITTWFWPGGKLKQAEMEYKNGEPVQAQAYDKKQRRVATVLYTDGKWSLLTYFHANGKKMYEMTAEDESETFWDAKGKKTDEETFKKTYLLPAETEDMINLLLDGGYEQELIPPPVLSEPNDALLLMPEVMPEYPGGQEAMMHFLSANIVYPDMAREMGMEGKVYVQFTVEKDGSIGDVKIMRGFDRECEREVIRVIKLMPNWEPGMQEGKPVRTRFTLPVVFSLQ